MASELELLFLLLLVNIAFWCLLCYVVLYVYLLQRHSQPVAPGFQRLFNRSIDGSPCCGCEVPSCGHVAFDINEGREVDALMHGGSALRGGGRGRWGRG